jgi:hypothetical protein
VDHLEAALLVGPEDDDGPPLFGLPVGRPGPGLVELELLLQVAPHLHLVVQHFRRRVPDQHLPVRAHVQDDVVLGVLVERLGRDRVRQLDRLVDLLHHEVGAQHEEHDQLQDDVEQRGQVRLAGFVAGGVGHVLSSPALSGCRWP